MKIRNIKDVFKGWLKSGYRFGFGFSNYLANRLDASPKTAKVGGGIFDVAAGGGLVYMAATSAIGTVIGAVAAVSAIASAPLAAVATVAMGVIWLSLSCMTAGIGFGLLGAARVKAGLPPLSSFFRRAKSVVNKGAEKISRPFKSDAKITHKFKNAANNNQPSAKTIIKPAPKLKP